jgi:hypothetical protein
LTRLTFAGLRNGRHTSVTWEDGALSGDPDVVEWIEYIARIAEASATIVGGIGGPYSSHDYLASPYSARELILSVFPGEVRQEGDLPPRIAPPRAIQ